MQARSHIPLSPCWVSNIRGPDADMDEPSAAGQPVVVCVVVVALSSFSSRDSDGVNGRKDSFLAAASWSGRAPNMFIEPCCSGAIVFRAGAAAGIFAGGAGAAESCGEWFRGNRLATAAR